MKMMGLNDATYYLSIYINFFVIACITSLLSTIMVISGVFMHINGFQFFIFCMLYCFNLLAWSFIIVSVLPTKRSSGIAVVLFSFISYYISFVISDPSAPSGLQYGLSVLPNICMNQIVKQIFFYNFQTD